MKEHGAYSHILAFGLLPGWHPVYTAYGFTMLFEEKRFTTGTAHFDIQFWGFSLLICCCCCFFTKDPDLRMLAFWFWFFFSSLWKVGWGSTTAFLVVALFVLAFVANMFRRYQYRVLVLFWVCYLEDFNFTT